MLKSEEEIDDEYATSIFFECIEQISVSGIYKKFKELKNTIKFHFGVRWMFSVCNIIENDNDLLTITYFTNIDDILFLCLRVSYKPMIHLDILKETKKVIDHLSCLINKYSEYHKHFDYKCENCLVRSKTPYKYYSDKVSFCSRKCKKNYCGKICENCGDIANKKCSGCSKVYYCSKDCQVIHWKLLHKKNCKNCF